MSNNNYDSLLWRVPLIRPFLPVCLDSSTAFPTSSWPLQGERVDFLRADVAAKNWRSVGGDTDLGIPVRTWSLAKSFRLAMVSDLPSATRKRKTSRLAPPSEMYKYLYSGECSQLTMYSVSFPAPGPTILVF